MKRRSYEEESQRGNETTVLRARGLRPAMPPPLKVQVTCFQMKGSMAPRQTDRQTVVPERLKFRYKKKRRTSLDRASKRDNEGMTKLLPEKKREGALDLIVRQKR